MIERIDEIKKNNLPFEYLWIDAGWYGIDTKPTPNEFDEDWTTKTGDWRISPLIHPDGFLDVSKAVHNAGLKLLLWLEPERVVQNTPITKEHPEYFLSNGIENCDLLLNLGNPNAFNYCLETVSDLIEKLNIDCYRQDFNFNPIDYWRNYDTPDRIGITEIKHINGLYKFWDTLLERFPTLIIDNCASGGRRIDTETLRRSVPLWRSDYQCVANYDSESAQLQTMTYGNWMPYSGSGTGRVYDEYKVRSAYSPALNMGFLYSEEETNFKSDEHIAFMKKYLNEYLTVRPYFSEDFYPLTGFTYELDNWCGMQFARPEEKDGLIIVFRRENFPYETASFDLRGLNENKDYLFKDIDGEEFVINGKSIIQNGFKVTLPQKRSSKIYLYKEI